MTRLLPRIGNLEGQGMALTQIMELGYRKKYSSSIHIWISSLYLDFQGKMSVSTNSKNPEIKP